MTDTKRDIPLYLSPDQKYITTTLYDLQDDPLAEEQARADATMKTLVADDPPERGARNAKVTIVEFSDFECPYCKKMKVMLDQEMKVDSQPSISIVFRSNPLSIHPWAKVAAQIAECVQLQNPSDFWKVHDFFFDNQQSITALNIGELSTQFITANTSIDIKLYHSCVTRDLAVGPVTQDLNMGQKFGVQGTPTLFINGVKAPPISDGSQLHSIIETIEHGGSALDMTLPVLNNSVPILANSGGQCAPTIRTGAANVEIK
jgi:protein-disulfide isomerase